MPIYAATLIAPQPIPHRAPDVAAIARDAASGDADALGALYDRFASSLVHTASRLCSSSADAQDVVHDVFVGLPEALAHYDERGQLEAWLRRIVVRMALMQRRRDGRRRETTLDDSPLPHATARTDAAAEFSDVQRAIAGLPDSLRDVLVLREIEGYSHDEIAELLGITAGASRVRLTRALESLRGTLAVGR